jgi:hypothetical protein
MIGTSGGLFVNAKKFPRVGNLFTEQLLALQEEFCFMEIVNRIIAQVVVDSGYGLNDRLQFAVGAGIFYSMQSRSNRL